MKSSLEIKPINAFKVRDKLYPNLLQALEAQLRALGWSSTQIQMIRDTREYIAEYIDLLPQYSD